jgi:hypothetical protein
MRLAYKQVKMMVEHCGDCGERLMGNNSIASPFRCSCGEWKLKYDSDFTPILCEYELIVQTPM